MDGYTLLGSLATGLGLWLALDLVLVALWCGALALGRRQGGRR